MAPTHHIRQLTEQLLSNTLWPCSHFARNSAVAPLDRRGEAQVKPSGVIGLLVHDEAVSSMIGDDAQGLGSPESDFRTTHWSLVLAARDGSSPQASAALEALCRIYWYPVYVFVRRRGLSVEDAQDLTQEFFTRLLRRDFLRNIAREKGRFRSFLLAALKNFLTSEWRRGQTARRGGAQTFVSWEELQAEERYALEPVSETTPDDLYEQQWALAVIEQAMQRLRAEFHAAGKRNHFETLKQWLSSEGSRADYEAAAGELGVSAGAVSVAVHRLRRRFAELLRAVVAHTVAGPEEVEDEVRWLSRALAG